MTWEEIEIQWQDLQGTIRGKWARLTENDYEMIAGKRERLLSKLYVRYGISMNEAEKELDIFIGGLD